MEAPVDKKKAVSQCASLCSIGLICSFFSKNSPEAGVVGCSVELPYRIIKYISNSCIYLYIVGDGRLFQKGEERVSFLAWIKIYNNELT